MANRFIPADERLAQQLVENISQTRFRDLGTFVSLYNSRMLAQTNEAVKTYAKALTEAFKDVKLRNGQIVFISESEILLSETMIKLEAWYSIARIKRELQDLIQGHFLEQSDTLFFNTDEKRLNKVKRLLDDDKAEMYEVLKNVDTLKVSEVELLGSLPGVERSETEIWVPVESIVSLDDTFITQFEIPVVPQVEARYVKQEEMEEEHSEEYSETDNNGEEYENTEY